MTNLAHTIPADQIALGKGEPVFPALRLLLSDHPAVLELINQREQYGIAKYGQALMTDDDRDTATEIANEMADTLAYMQKMIMQHGFDDWIGELILRQVKLCDEMLRYLDAFSDEELAKGTKI